jgi:MFS family permease
MNGTVIHPNWKKLILQMLVGSAIGAAVASVAVLAFKGRGLNISDPGQAIALVAGLVYALIGLMVGFGALAPRTGARFLNVENAEELREERPKLGLGAMACLLTGVFFLTLATIPPGGEGGLLGRDFAACVVGICLAALVIMTPWTSRKTDELTRQVTLEASTFCMSAILILFGGWAGLAHLGYVTWVTPLAFVAGLALLQLFAIFWIAFKRGMLTGR